jgi:hypothetical protein
LDWSDNAGSEQADDIDDELDIRSALSPFLNFLSIYFDQVSFNVIHESGTTEPAKEPEE